MESSNAQFGQIGRQKPLLSGGQARLMTLLLAILVSLLTWASTVRASTPVSLNGVPSASLEKAASTLGGLKQGYQPSKNKDDGAVPSEMQYSVAAHLVVGVLNGELTPRQFDQMISSLNPVLLHVCFYYLRAYEMNRGVTEFSKSNLAAYFEQTRVQSVVLDGLINPSVLSKASVVSFHSEFPATQSGVRSLTQQDLMGLFLKPFSSES